VFVDAVTRPFWILIDDKGGRATGVFDPRVLADTTRYVTFGASGAFKPRPGKAVEPGARVQAMFDPVGGIFVGRVVYESQDFNTPIVVMPVPNTRVFATCYDPMSETSSQVYTQADAGGYFSFTCYAQNGYLPVWLNTFVNQYAVVSGYEGAPVGGTTYLELGVTGDLLTANDNAARSFIRISTAASRTQAKFGTTRSAVAAYVSDAQPNAPTSYRTCCDRIYLGPTRIWDDAGLNSQDGTFVISHEYGHAFHYMGIDTWGSVSCHNNTHSINALNTYSCAFVEGFADFFSVWVMGDYLTSGQESGGYTTDNFLEQNTYRLIGEGGGIEGAVAAFMYDLVDGAGEPDGANNQPDGDEAFDVVAFSGADLRSTIRNCILGATKTTMNGVDQLAPCAERSVAARSAVPIAFQGNWVAWNSVSGGSPAYWSATEVRRLWLYNLYNVGP
jgi:hypothetical protein